MPEITSEQLQILLQKIIKADHSDLIASVIIAHLETTTIGLEQLAMSLMGVAPMTNFKPLDEVYVNFQSLATWRMSREEMEKAGKIFKGKVYCVVIETNIYSKETVHVRYECIDDTGKEKHEEMWVNEKDVSKTDRTIFEDDDNLPF